MGRHSDRRFPDCIPEWDLSGDRVFTVRAGLQEWRLLGISRLWKGKLAKLANGIQKEMAKQI